MKKNRWTRADYTRVAVQLFVAKGVHCVPDKAITTELKVKPNAISKHFPGRDRRASILSAALKDCWEHLGKLIAISLSEFDEDTPPHVKLERIVKACVGAFRTDDPGNRNALLFLAMYYRDPSLDYHSEQLDGFFQLLDGLIGSAKVHGGPSPVAVREALIGAMLEMLYSWTTMRDGRSRSRKGTGAEPYALKDIERVMFALLGTFLGTAGTRPQ